MSLVNQAVVMATYYCLKNRTWAADKVFRQPVDPIEQVLRAAEEDQKPVIGVFMEQSRFKHDGRQTQGSKNEAELKIFVYVAPGKVDLPDEVAFVLDTNTAGLTLDIMIRQVDACFHVGDEAWMQIWRKFVPVVKDRQIRYMLIELEEGVKVPTAEICYYLDTVPDPDFVGTMGVAWEMFDTKLRTMGQEAITYADIFKNAIIDPSTVPDYAALIANFGLTREAAAATGLYPYDINSVDAEGNTPELTEVDADGQIVIVPEEENP